tara:strand:+ start:173 stop:388 length:216 start_codon:yes stop_codon:yes gene_type:complete
MPSKDYEHYRLLSSEDLISMIEKKDSDIKTLQKNLKDTQELKNKYYAYNQYHMEEISRLDKTIGKLKGLRG